MMDKKRAGHVFQLEALEPRLLLSGDASPVAAGFAAGLDHIPVLVEQLQTSPDHLNQRLPLIGHGLTDILDPAAQLEDLFAGLTEAELASPDDLVKALDAEPEVDAELVERTDDDFALDLHVSDVFEGVVPLSADPEDASALEPPHGRSLYLDGTVRLTGDWALSVRVSADLGYEGPQFSIDPTLTSLRVNVVASDAVLVSGWYADAEVTSITDMQFQASLETDRRADSVDPLDLELLSGAGVSLLSTSVDGHAAITLQLVETLNAAHGPPRVPLVWQELSARARPSTGTAAVLGTDLSEAEKPGASDILLPGWISWTYVPESSASGLSSGPSDVVGGSLAASVLSNDAIRDVAVVEDDLAELHLGILGSPCDFDARAELIFDGLDPPAAPELTGTSLLRASDPSSPADLPALGSLDAASPFEFAVVSSSPSDLALRLNGEHLEIVDRLTGRLLASRPLERASEIVIHGVDDLDDTLTVDFSGGVIEAPITFHGGAAGFDSLVIDGGLFASSSYVATGPDSGTIALDATAILFTGLEPVTIISDADHAFHDATTGNQQIRIVDHVDAGYITIDSNETGGFEEVTFLNPTSSLTIDAGDGNDTITIAALDDGFSVPIIVNGGAGDDRLVIHDGTAVDVTFNGGDGSDAVVNPDGVASPATLSAPDLEFSIDPVESAVDAFGEAAEVLADVESTFNGVGLAVLSGGFAFSETVEEDGTTKILVGGASIDLFLGYTNSDGERIGIEIEDAKLGLLLLKTADELPTYALEATGSAAFVGVPGFVLQGDIVVRMNETGAEVDESISVPNPGVDETIVVDIVFDNGANCSSSRSSRWIVPRCRGSMVWRHWGRRRGVCLGWVAIVRWV